MAAASRSQYGARLKEGQVMKFPPMDQARRRRNLKKRWIILWESCHVSYYSDSGAETCRGVINLAQCERVEPDFKHFLVTSTESAFALHCKDSSGKERTYAFIVGTNADDAMHQWADEIERKRKHVQGEPEFVRRYSQHGEALYASIKRTKKKVESRPLPELPPPLNPRKAAMTMAGADFRPEVSHRPTASPMPAKGFSLPRSLPSRSWAGSFEEDEDARRSASPQVPKPHRKLSRGWESALNMTPLLSPPPPPPPVAMPRRTSGELTEDDLERLRLTSATANDDKALYADMSGVLSTKISREEDSYVSRRKPSSTAASVNDEDLYTDMSGVLSQRSRRGSRLLVPSVASGRELFDGVGGSVNAGSVSLFVPPNAVANETTFAIDVYFDSSVMPPIHSATDDPDDVNEVILSPVVFVEPHDQQLNGTIFLRLPHAAPSLAGWSLHVLRCNASANDFPLKWEEFATHPASNSSGRGSFSDPQNGLIGLNHCCWLCIKGLADPRLDPELALRVVLYGKPLATNGTKWAVNVLAFRDSGDADGKLRVQAKAGSDSYILASSRVPLPHGARVAFVLHDPSGTWACGRSASTTRRVVDGSTFWTGLFEEEVSYRFDFVALNRGDSVDEFTCQCDVEVKKVGDDDDDDGEADFSTSLQVREPLSETGPRTPPVSPPGSPQSYLV